MILATSTLWNNGCVNLCISGMDRLSRIVISWGKYESINKLWRTDPPEAQTVKGVPWFDLDCSSTDQDIFARGRGVLIKVNMIRGCPLNSGGDPNPGQGIKKFFYRAGESVPLERLSKYF